MDGVLYPKDIDYSKVIEYVEDYENRQLAKIRSLISDVKGLEDFFRTEGVLSTDLELEVLSKLKEFGKQFNGNNALLGTKFFDDIYSEFQDVCIDVLNKSNVKESIIKEFINSKGIKENFGSSLTGLFTNGEPGNIEGFRTELLSALKRVAWTGKYPDLDFKFQYIGSSGADSDIKIDISGRSYDNSKRGRDVRLSMFEDIKTSTEHGYLRTRHISLDYYESEIKHLILKSKYRVNRNTIYLKPDKKDLQKIAMMLITEKWIANNTKDGFAVASFFSDKAGNVKLASSLLKTKELQLELTKEISKVYQKEMIKIAVTYGYSNRRE